ncbi:MAG: hypothetical protein V2I26_10485 [Halieaceae bacterium]|jgi:hypothetical protein|nr:hypothetical protein [Halieaceae bacterium]
MKYALVLLLLAINAAPANAEVIAASPDHYTLRHEAVSPLAPDALWNRLVHPESWWSPVHSYSGDAANLSLDLRAGGLWKEEWDGGSVAHGYVLYVNPGEQLRLEAPFGPLQSMAVNVVWTISVRAEGTGSKVIFDEVANGSEASRLDTIAGTVDGVKAEALRRLVAAGD